MHLPQDNKVLFCPFFIIRIFFRNTMASKYVKLSNASRYQAAHFWFLLFHFTSNLTIEILTKFSQICKFYEFSRLLDMPDNLRSFLYTTQHWRASTLVWTFIFNVSSKLYWKTKVWFCGHNILAWKTGKSENCYSQG